MIFVFLEKREQFFPPLPFLFISNSANFIRNANLPAECLSLLGALVGFRVSYSSVLTLEHHENHLFLRPFNENATTHIAGRVRVGGVGELLRGGRGRNSLQGVRGGGRRWSLGLCH